MEADIDDYNKKFFNSNIAEFKRIFVAVAGPLVNLFFVLFLRNNNESFMVYSNLLIFLLNLLPIFPLDGGNFLKSLFSIFVGRCKANIIVNKVSNVVIILLTVITSCTILYLKNVAIVFILLYLWDLVTKENKKIELQKQFYKY